MSNDGAIRKGGGAFGKMQQVHEDQYFRELQAEQFKNLKEHLSLAVAYHECRIKHHQEEMAKSKADHEKHIKEHKEAIEKHKINMAALHKEASRLDCLVTAAAPLKNIVHHENIVNKNGRC